MTEDKKTVSHPAVVGDTLPAIALPRAIAEGPLRVGDAILDCHTLADEKRLVTRRTILAGLTGKGGETKGGPDKGNLGRYLSRLPKRFAHLAADPGIEFTTLAGVRAIGHEVAFFSEILDAYVSSALAGELKPSQSHLAVQAHILNQGAKAVGWVALHDEATGLQAIRTSNALQRILNRIVQPIPTRWKILWTPDIVGAICRAFHIPYSGKGFPKWMSGVAELVYDLMLGPEVHDELRRVNPDRPDRNMHHQHLQDEAREVTREDLLMVAALADQSSNKAEFWARMRRHFSGTPIQLMLSNYDAPRLTKKGK